MDLIFYLSGEHDTLPRSEALSLLKYHGFRPTLLEDLGQVVVCRVEQGDLGLLRRLGMTHEVLEFHGSCEARWDPVLGLASNIPPIEGSFSVRITRLNGSSKEIGKAAVEKALGDKIEGEEVDFKNPAVSVRGFFSRGRFILGVRIIEFKRSEFDCRSPHRRPFFHPSSMQPTLSRTLVNLAGVKEGDFLLDPFCGTGGILIEAGLVGARVHGLDLDKNMVEGCRENLFTYGVTGLIELGDATKLGFKDAFDVVITDPPYGRGSTTHGANIQTLYNEAAQSIYRSLKKGGRACMLSPENINLPPLLEEAGLEVLETHILRVHKSLTRRIVVACKQ